MEPKSPGGFLGFKQIRIGPNERGLLWRDGVFAELLNPGSRRIFDPLGKIRVSVHSVTDNGGAVAAGDLPPLWKRPEAAEFFEIAEAPAGMCSVYFLNGEFSGVLGPGRHVFWRTNDVREFRLVDRREQTLDINGQELLTADKLTIRVNALLNFKIADPEKSVLAAADSRQALYREAQLALRAAVTGRELDALLADRDALAAEVAEALRERLPRYGAEAIGFGVRDVILPGDVRALLLKATEARKTSEAATIARREETAALRHQLNAARLLADNPALMRMRELETLEKLASGGSLTLVLGEKSLERFNADSHDK